MTAARHPTRAPVHVRDAMTAPVVTVTADAPFAVLVDHLVERDIGALPVVSDDGVLEGIVTETDLVTKVAYGGRHRRALEVLADVVAGGETRWAIKARGLRAANVLTHDVVTARPDEPLRQVARLMVDQERSHVIVVDDARRVVGIVSRRDLLRHLHQPDEVIAELVADVLADPLQVPEDHDLQVAVDDGVVVLTGTVRDESDLRVVVAAIWRVPGIVDVHTYVRVPTAPTSRPTR